MSAEIKQIESGSVMGKVSVAASQLANALALAQAEFSPVVKAKTATVRTKSGGEYAYSYADFADVLKMALPILSKHGLAFSQPLMRKDGKLCVTTRLMHASGETLASDGIWIPETTSPQEFGSCLTYWRRYDGCSLLGIQPDDDEDAKLAVLASKKAKGTDKLEKKEQESQRLLEYIKPFQVDAFFNAAKKYGQKSDTEILAFLKEHGISSAQEIKKGDFDMCIKWASTRPTENLVSKCAKHGEYPGEGNCPKCEEK